MGLSFIKLRVLNEIILLVHNIHLIPESKRGFSD